MSELINRPWPISERRAPHIFGDETQVTPSPSPRGKSQIERTCAVCGVVKITVFGEGHNAWREWRLKDVEAQFADDRTPACSEVKP